MGDPPLSWYVPRNISITGITRYSGVWECMQTWNGSYRYVRRGDVGESASWRNRAFYKRKQALFPMGKIARITIY